MDDAYRRWRETTVQLWDAASDASFQRGNGARQGRDAGRENGRETREPAVAARQAKQES
jgi:hypothetical protein